ncbi:MAG: hypothetical protein J6M14_05885, partial [Campylobacter sp.]|nr:hypothetical protein [Campylobacter sp.]
MAIYEFKIPCAKFAVIASECNERSNPVKFKAKFNLNLALNYFLNLTCAVKFSVRGRVRFLGDA